MDSQLPRRLDRLCESLGISFFDLKLPCAFCDFHLTLQELAEFYEKSLSVLYRNGMPYGACRGCLKLSAKHEYEQFCRCVVLAEILPDLVNQPLSTICMRCLCCYRLLDPAEKIDLYAGNENVYLVRTLWRGRCRECRKK